MFYIIFDLEFNQDATPANSEAKKISQKFAEIIQIGAIKLDADLNTVGIFNRYIKPAAYKSLAPFVMELTGITMEQLCLEEQFPSIFSEFNKFIGEEESVFGVWGLADMKVLFRNMEYHEIDKKYIPHRYINIQPYVSRHLEIGDNRLLKLQSAVEALAIGMPYQFHDALSDAYYTAEIFKKVKHPFMIPIEYHSNAIIYKPRRPKKVTDFDKLIHQFEKMYARELNIEEQEMIKLAYKMGKTQQFLK